MHEETFAATDFATKSIDEWTKWLSAYCLAGSCAG